MSRAPTFCAGMVVGGSLVASALGLRWILRRRGSNCGAGSNDATAVQDPTSTAVPNGCEAVAVLRLHCCSCGHRRPATAFQSKQARRRDDQRKCRACVDLYKSGPLPALRSETLEANKAKHRQHMAVRAAKTERAATEAAEAAGVAPATDADSADDPLRLARKAETVLRGRTDRVLLILENCSDDFNHVAVLRTCEALGVMRVWLVETADRPTKNTYVQPGTASDSSGPAAAAASLSAGATKAQRQLESRCVQRGFEYDRMLGLRRAQLFAAHLDVETFATSTECIAAARAAGRELWVTDLAQDALPLSSDAAALAVQLPPYVAVVLGAEATGVVRVRVPNGVVRVRVPNLNPNPSPNSNPDPNQVRRRRA